MKYIERQIPLVIDPLTEETVAMMLTQKYQGWSYEREVRLYPTRTDLDVETGLAFVQFTHLLTPSVLYVGYMNSATDDEIFGIIGDDYRETLKLVRVKPCCHEFKLIDRDAPHIVEPTRHISRSKRKTARRQQIGG